MLKSFVEVDREFRRRAVQDSAQEKELRLLRERINQLAGLTNPSEIVVVEAGDSGDVVTAGSGLTGGGPTPCTIDVGGGSGILIHANSVSVDQAYEFYWTDAHHHSGNVFMDDGAGNSPYIAFVGGSNDDTVYIYLDDDATSGDSDLIIKMCDALLYGDSQIRVLDSNNTMVAYISSGGDILATSSVYVGDRIYHYGDADTYIRFQADQQTVAVGGMNVVDVTTSEVEFNAGSNDIDLIVQSDNHSDAFVVRGSDGQITLGALTSGYVKSDASGALSTSSSIPIADLGGNVLGSLIIGGAVNWTTLPAPGAAGRALVSTATTAQWSNTPSWQGEHTFNAGLEVPDDQSISLGNAGDATIKYDSGDNDVVVDGADWVFNLDNVSISSSVSTKPTLSLECSHGDGNPAEFVLYKNSASPADNDDLGVIEFWGNDDNVGHNATRFAYILGEALDVTDGDEAGHIKFMVRVDNTERSFLELAGHNGTVGEAEFIVNQAGIDMDVRFEASGVVHAWKIRGSDGYIGVNEASPDRRVEIVDASSAQLRLSQTAVVDYCDFEVDGSGHLSISPTGGIVRLANSQARLLWDGISGGAADTGGQYDDSGGSARYWLMFDSDDVIICNRAANGVVQIRANAAAGSGGEVTVAEYQDDVIEFYVDLHLERSAGSPEIQFTDTNDSDHFEIWHDQSQDRLRIGSNSEDPILTLTKAGRVGVGVNALVPSGKLHASQSDVSGGIPTLYINQSDVDQPFIEFSGGTVYNSKSGQDEYLKVTDPNGNTKYLRLFA